MPQSIENKKPVVLTIAGFDPSCGAGIGADLKTIAACGGYGVAVVTALTVQNTREVRSVVAVKPHLLISQLECLLEEISPRAVKIGMLGTKGIVKAVASYLHSQRLSNLVLDPVLRSTSGSLLLERKAVDTFKSKLLPLADCLTPNLYEAGLLAEMKVDSIASMKQAAERIVDLGCKAVVITGGHLHEPTDVLFDGSSFAIFPGHRIGRQRTHGTGCAFSSALACYLAHGCSLREATQKAKRFTTRAIRHSLSIGRGHALNHFFG